MSEELIARLQRDMQALGLYEGFDDGKWGPMTEGAWQAALGAARVRQDIEVPNFTGIKPQSIAWSARVSSVFVERVLWIRDALNWPDPAADWLMACIAWETGERFSPDVKNGAGSGATGLIQFMPKTAIGLGTTVEKLARMSAEDQLNYVYKYFAPYKGKINNLADMYMAILWPNAVGKPMAHVLWEAGESPKTYLQNKGLDVNGDKKITKTEAASKVQKKLEMGRLRTNLRAA